MIIWCSVSLLTGWFSGFAGIIVKSEYDSINYVWLNLIGVGCVVLSLILSSLIKVTVDKEKDSTKVELMKLTAISDEGEGNE
jgi:hypothetical protein